MKRKILLQLDTDSHASSFDAVVAIDSGVDFLLPYSNVEPDSAVGLVHGAMFTRGPDDLASTAIFVGGSNVTKGEAVLKKIKKTLFDPLKVSVVLDCNGCNSTASAAVLCAMKHVDLSNAKAVVMGATGAVGQRVSQLLLSQGTEVAVGSRDVAKAQQVVDRLASADTKRPPKPFGYSGSSVLDIMKSFKPDVLFACGAAGVELVSVETLASADSLKVAIDLNAVAPLGIAGIQVMDKAKQRGERLDYGALGIGGLKMKIHKAAIRAAFEKRGIMIDANEMLEIGRSL